MCGRYDILGNYRLCILVSDGEEAPRTENEGKLPLLPTIEVHGIFLNRISMFLRGRAFKQPMPSTGSYLIDVGWESVKTREVEDKPRIT